MTEQIKKHLDDFQFVVTGDKGQVYVNFCQPVTHLIMRPHQAKKLAEQLKKYADVR